MARRLSLGKQVSQSGIAAELLTLLETVTADGVISNEEAEQLKTWLTDNANSDLPGIEFLRVMINQVLADGKVSEDERRETYRAIERVLPPEARRVAKERRMAVEAHERTERKETKARERAERILRTPLASANFMVAGVLYEGRSLAVRRFASVGDTVFLARDPNNPHDANAIEVRLCNGCQIGFVPREYAADLAPLLDSGCTHRAYLTKVLAGRRAPIPVVQVSVFQREAEIEGAVSQFEVPVRSAIPVTVTQGCTTVIVVLLVLFALAVVAIFSSSTTR